MVVEVVRRNRTFTETASRATLDALEALVEELDDAHDEHPDVSVSDKSEWTLSAYGDGLLVWENAAEDDEPRHMKALSSPGYG